MDQLKQFRLSADRISTNPVLSLEAWAIQNWVRLNPSGSRARVARKLESWLKDGRTFPLDGIGRLIRSGLLPEGCDAAAEREFPRVVGLLFDPLSGQGLVDPLVTTLSDDLDSSALLPFTAGDIRSLLLRLCESHRGVLSGGMPEAIGFNFSETLRENCRGNSMDIAGLLSALDAISRRTCNLFSAACAVVQPGLEDELIPVGSVAIKLGAFVREYGRGSLLVKSSNCGESKQFESAFENIWLVDSIDELVARIADLSEVRGELIRSDPLDARKSSAILGQLAFLIDHEREHSRAVNLCERVEACGFAPSVPKLTRLNIKQHHANALRHSGRYTDSLRIVAEMDLLLEDCAEILCYEEEVRQAISKSSALLDGCDFDTAAELLRPWVEVFQDDSKCVSAQRRIELYNTLARVLVMLDCDGWEPLFRESIRLQRLIDPASIRRTEGYLLHGLLRNSKLIEAGEILERHEADLSCDEFSSSFTTFFRCDLDRRLGRQSEPPNAQRPIYTTAFALLACARQAGRTPSEAVRMLDEAEKILRSEIAGKPTGNVLTLIAAAVSLTNAVYGGNVVRWNQSRMLLSEYASLHGSATQHYFSTVLSSLANVPSIEACERLLRLMPNL